MTTPAHTVREYLEEHGETVVPFHNLLTTWRVDEPDLGRRIAIEQDLDEEGVKADPDLRWVRPESPVRLRAVNGGPPQNGSVLAVSRPGQPRANAALALTAALLLLAGGGALAGYHLGKDPGADLARAEAQGRRSGLDEAVARQDPAVLRAARATGGREGYRRAYRPAFDRARAAVLAAAPKRCGDARMHGNPVLTRVRAQGVSCAAAVEFVRGCQTSAPGCEGYGCRATSIAWESREVTCTRAGATIRYVTGV